MADVVIDANVLVGLLDEHDTLFPQATALLARLDSEGHVPLVLDVLLGEALSVLCRRATERKTNPPDLARAIDQARQWLDGGEVAFVAHEQERLWRAMLDVIDQPGAR
jgi:predicted nucleic acid-binding protein